MQFGQLGGEASHPFRITGSKPILDPNIAPFDPPKPRKPLPEHRQPRLADLIVLGKWHEGANAPNPLRRLLRPRRERPRRRRAAEQGDELAPPHSITSPARASSVGGTSMPSALAVFRL